MSAIYNWLSFPSTGDEWLAGALCAANVSIGVNEFMIGHAIELYLKGYHFKLFSDEQKVISFGHNILKLWRFFKTETSGFMPGYEFRDHILAIDFLNPTAMSVFSLEDRQHYTHHQSLYRMMKHLPDLKYDGLPWKSRPVCGDSVKGYATRDPYWIAFFKELRRSIGYPESHSFDRMREILDFGHIPNDAKIYLEGLYQ